MLMARFQSEGVCTAAYECAWYEMLPDEKRRVQMIIMRGQKPVALRTGPFGSLSMPLFAEVRFFPSAQISVRCTLRGPYIE